MNRLTFFKRLFQSATVATVAPKVEASQKPIFILKGNDLILMLKREEHRLNLRR